MDIQTYQDRTTAELVALLRPAYNPAAAHNLASHLVFGMAFCNDSWKRGRVRAGYYEGVKNLTPAEYATFLLPFAPHVVGVPELDAEVQKAETAAHLENCRTALLRG